MTKIRSKQDAFHNLKTLKLSLSKKNKNNSNKQKMQIKNQARKQTAYLNAAIVVRMLDQAVCTCISKTNTML